MIRKIFIVLMINFFLMSNVNAAVETYEGTDEYYVLGAVENINVARERAKERALRDAREKAGVYIHSFSRVTNMKMLEEEIISVTSGVLRVVETAYEVVQLTDMDGYLIRAKVKADIDSDDVEKFLQKDAEEISKVAAHETFLRVQEEEEENKIETLKREYRQAKTPEEKEIIAKQIVEEDKVFLSNLKLREGNKYRDEGNHKQAAKLFGEAIELNPENAMAWNNRGWSYIEQKKYKLAIADFDRAAQLNPNSELPYLGRGWVYHQTKEYALAINEYNKAIEFNPKYANAWNNRGAAKSWLNQMPAAIKDYDKAIELKPNYVKAYENRGKAWRALGNSEKANADFKYATKLTRSHEGGDKFIEEALSLSDNGKYDEALEVLNQAAELFPDNQYVFVNRGNIYNNYFRDYEAAIADYNKTIEINDKFSWPYLNRGIAYGRLKRWEEAIADYGRAIELDKNYASAYNGRAWSYCQINNFEAALADAQKALKLKPNEANFFDTRASAYIGLKRYKEALDDLNTAIKLSPEGWLYHNRGELYKLMGEEDKAKADFAKAKKLGYSN